MGDRVEAFTGAACLCLAPCTFKAVHADKPDNRAFQFAATLRAPVRQNAKNAHSPWTKKGKNPPFRRATPVTGALAIYSLAAARGHIGNVFPRL